MDQNGKMYHFISDPKHKENLSGRVTAACLNCRRKKVKCSGKADCDTCRDKGLVCEGLPTRKRPKNSDRPLETVETILDTRKSVSVPGRIKHGAKAIRPTPKLTRSSESTRTDDSGYASSESFPRAAIDTAATAALEDQLSAPTSATFVPDRRLFSRHEMSIINGDSVISPSNSSMSDPLATVADSRLPKYDSPSAMSPAANNNEEWILPGPKSPLYQNQCVDRTLSLGSQSTQLSPVVLPSASVDSYGRRHSETMWYNGTNSIQSAEDLISAARVLEEQARKLRRLASHHIHRFKDELGQPPIAYQDYLREVPSTSQDVDETVANNAVGNFDGGFDNSFKGVVLSMDQALQRNDLTAISTGLASWGFSHHENAPMYTLPSQLQPRPLDQTSRKPTESLTSPTRTVSLVSDAVPAYDRPTADDCRTKLNASHDYRY